MRGVQRHTPWKIDEGDIHLASSDSLSNAPVASWRASAKLFFSAVSWGWGRDRRPQKKGKSFGSQYDWSAPRKNIEITNFR